MSENTIVKQNIVKQNGPSNLLKFETLIKEKSIHYLIGIIIFIIFYIIASLIRKRYMSLKDSKEVKDKLFYEFIGYVLFYVIIIIGLVVSLLYMGFNLSTVLVCLGSAGIAIALAIQSTITQVISGVFILILNLYNINDIIQINGIQGYVTDFSLFNTTISNLTDITTIIPNNQFLSQPFTNYTKTKTIKYTFTVAISANNSIDYDILMNNIKQKISAVSKYCIDKSGIIVSVDEMGMSGTIIRVKVPINSADLFYADMELKAIVRTVLSSDNVLLLDNSYVSSDIGTSNIKYFS